MLLFWSSLFVNGMMVMSEGGNSMRVVRWQGTRLVKWQVGKVRG